jgi:hypothetical protein
MATLIFIQLYEKELRPILLILEKENDYKRIYPTRSN